MCKVFESPKEALGSFHREKGIRCFQTGRFRKFCQCCQVRLEVIAPSTYPAANATRNLSFRLVPLAILFAKGRKLGDAGRLMLYKKESKFKVGFGIDFT
jgi:hypothetical protein